MSRKSKRRILTFEPLEPRQLLDGNVFGGVAAGQLNLTGDQHDNALQIVAGAKPGQVVVTGLASQPGQAVTQVNGKTAPVTFAGVTALVVVLQGGNNRVVIGNLNTVLTFPGSLTVVGMGGSDDIEVNRVVAGSLTIDTVGGSDIVSLQECVIRQELLVKLDSGADSLLAEQNEVGGGTCLLDAGGKDQINSDYQGSNQFGKLALSGFDQRYTLYAGLSPAAASMAEWAMNYEDLYWDEQAGLLADPAGPLPGTGVKVDHLTRETVDYAAGLLERGAPGDSQRAARALQAVLNDQNVDSTSTEYGNFPTSPEAPKTFDPNWRQFIGTDLETILIKYSQKLPASLVTAIDGALNKTVVGALAHGLPAASYTNIALLSVFLLESAGQQLKQSAWVSKAVTFGDSVDANFNQNNCFPEYNSPTYTGVDFDALALLSNYSASSKLKTLGTELEADLWRQEAQYYNAGLKNLCGPYDRQYGIDMEEYCSVLGEAIGVVVGKGLAPVPNTAQPFSHQDDICWTPLLAAVGLTVPGSVLADYSSFPGEHQVSQVIDSTTGRTATAWLTSSVMLGGEDLGSPPAKSSQKAQATGQWLASNGEVGWLTLTAPDSANAQAGAGTLTVWGDAATQAETVTMTFEISAPGNTPSITAGQWKLDGVTFQVTGFGNFSASHQGDVWTVSYSGTIQAGQQPRIVLQVV